MSRASAEDRLGRLLAIVPWVVSRDGPKVEEICRRFGVDQGDLLADLELLFLCGVHPFTPDTLIEVDVAEGRVWIRFAEWFRRPLRLTAPEALALLAAGEAWLAVPGADPDGALARALGKLEQVLGVAAPGALDVALDEVSAETLECVRQGADEHRKVEIEYYSFGRDERSVRVVAPWQVFNREGAWYLSGWCEQARGERLFRLDRISRATLLDERFTPSPLRPAPPTWTPGPGDPRWVLDLSPGARWVAERYPHEGMETLGDGRLRVRLRSARKAWMERLLLRGGPDVEVVEGDSSLAPDAARRLLARYRADGDDHGA